jgi:hypothetical protein
MAAAAIWLVLTLAALVRAAGGSVPHFLEVVCAAAAAPIAIAAAGHAIVAYWRGPTIVSFLRTDSEDCSADEAAYVRLASQLRGTIGGAGFLNPARLALPAVAWLSAAVEGLALLAPGADASVFVVLAIVGIGSAAAAVLLPPHAYYYREATGGTAIVSPPSAARRLKRLAARERALAAGAAAGSATPVPPPLGAALGAASGSPPDGAS